MAAGRVELYQDEAGKWRWRRYAGTRIVADSGEGYESKQHAEEQAAAEAVAFDVELEEK